jgi:UDP-3-O-[3-hydroxymyristoyl] glucosamine N-acyltransferase
MKLTISELAISLKGKLIGDGAGQISSVGPIKNANNDTITFITSNKYIPELKRSNAGAVITSQQIDDIATPQIIVTDVNTALIETLNIFAPKLQPRPAGIARSADVAPTAKVSASAYIGRNAVIADGVEIGENTIIDDGCKIGENSKIGKNCRLDCNVVVYHNCIIGNNVIIQANSVIGSTGFGYSFINGAHRLIPHNGGVIIDDFVEIGVSCCVARAKFGNTAIGAGTKIDNLVQISHNVTIGRCCLIAGQSGVAGSGKLGDGVILAGQSGVGDNVEIADGVIVGARAGVTHNITDKALLFGMPAVEKHEAFKIIALTRRLPKLVEQLNQLNKRIEKIENILKQTPD